MFRVESQNCIIYFYILSFQFVWISHLRIFVTLFSLLYFVFIDKSVSYVRLQLKLEKCEKPFRGFNFLLEN